MLGKKTLRDSASAEESRADGGRMNGGIVHMKPDHCQGGCSKAQQEKGSVLPKAAGGAGQKAQTQVGQRGAAASSGKQRVCLTPTARMQNRLAAKSSALREPATAACGAGDFRQDV